MARTNDAKPKRRPWVKLYSAVISDDRLLDLSPPAKALFFFGLAYSGAYGTDGVIPTNARSVSRWSGLDITEAGAAIDELVASGLLVTTHEVTRYSAWDRLQVTQEKFEERLVGTAKRVNTSRANQAAELAGVGIATTAAVEVALNEEPDATVTPLPVVGEQPQLLNTPPELKAADVRAKFRAWLDRMVETVEPSERVASYEIAYTDQVAAYCERYARVRGVKAESLEKEVVLHEAATFGADLSVVNDVTRLQALRVKHGIAVVPALPEALASATGDWILYLKRILEPKAAR